MNRIVAAFVAVVVILLGLSSMFVVSEGHSALVLQFGRIVHTDYQPGLHFKLPVLQQVIHFDKRIHWLRMSREITQRMRAHRANNRPE